MSVVLISAAPAGELTEAGARRLTDKIRGKLAVAWDLLEDAIAREAWRVLGYDSLADWLQAEFGDLRLLRITKDQRRDVVGAMRSQGMSVRAISRALGVSVGQVHADTQPVAVTRLRTVEPVAETQQPKTDRVVALIAAQGDRGMTCRELELETGWGHGPASGALSRVAKQRRVVPTGEFRHAHNVYVVS